MSVNRVGAVVTRAVGRATGVRVGNLVAVFGGGVSVAVAWWKDARAAAHVGARRLRKLEGGPGRDVAGPWLPRGDVLGPSLRPSLEEEGVCA